LSIVSKKHLEIYIRLAMAYKNPYDIPDKTYMYCKVSDERLMQLIDENDGDDNKTLWRVLQSAFLQVTHIALKEDIQTFLQNKSVRFPNAVEYIIQHPISKKSELTADCPQTPSPIRLPSYSLGCLGGYHHMVQPP
jgi:hypothetical protein